MLIKLSTKELIGIGKEISKVSVESKKIVAEAMDVGFNEAALTNLFEVIENCNKLNFIHIDYSMTSGLAVKIDEAFTVDFMKLYGQFIIECMNHSVALFKTLEKFSNNSEVLLEKYNKKGRYTYLKNKKRKAK